MMSSRSCAWRNWPASYDMMLACWITHPRLSRVQTQLLHHYQDVIDGCHVTYETNTKLSRADQLLKAGMMIQDLCDEDGRSWSANPRFTSGMIAWPSYTGAMFDEISAALENIRSDELVVESLDMTQELTYIAGHTRALVKWAATIRHAMAFEGDTWSDQVCESSIRATTSRYVWWAQRINLKIYGLH